MRQSAWKLRSLAWVGAVGLLALTAACSNEKAPKEYSGPIAATKDKTGKITGVTLTTAKGRVYSIVLDEKGKALGEKLHGKRAIVTGVSAKEGEQRLLTVVEFREAEAAKTTAKDLPAKAEGPEKADAPPAKDAPEKTEAPANQEPPAKGEGDAPAEPRSGAPKDAPAKK
jgi:hypothetical protein